MTFRSPSTLAEMVGEVGYALRLPRDLKADLERWARQDRRSLNAQIVFLLDSAVEKAKESGELASKPGGRQDRHA
jgi:hypothetical protein